MPTSPSRKRRDRRKKFLTARGRLERLAPELLEAVRAGGRYSDALKRYQDQGASGQMIPGTDDLEALFIDWHEKGHAAIAKAEGVS
jgi:hypothetical protein